MNKFVALTLLTASTAAALPAFAQQEQGRVLSATPVIQQVAIPQQVCGSDYVYTRRQPTGGGALLGAIVGGLAGSAIGGGSGRAAAIAIGSMSGSIVGNQVEAGPPGYYPVHRCGTQTSYESRTIGYDVTYEYAGRRYTTRTDYQPGAWIPLSVQPTGQGYGGQYGQYDQYGRPYEQPYSQYPQQYQQQQYQPQYQQPQVQYQPPQQQPQGYYSDNRYDEEGSYGYDSGYQGNPYPGQNGYGAPQAGVVVSSPTGSYTAPVTDNAIEYRNSRGEAYRQ
ncbi:glycine zipper 2TM domain-containing protein [Diaphorobacter caeni]|uniref:glycine zipper 2TM domain-containing protein n=1 Tax=Diaphorobacter caeni TaxID=2784387 RepID=UPI0038991DB1